MTRRRLALVAVIAVALAGLTTVGAWASTRAMQRPAGTYAGSGMMNGGSGPGMMGGRYGNGMMGSYVLPGDGRQVRTLDAARERAQLFADRFGLRVGEVMQFSDNFYAELLTGDGGGATEVLVDPAGGAVRIEPGPAMMWNTRYGMRAAGATSSASVSADEARRIAQRWLDGHRAGSTAAEPTAFPGYYTMDFTRGGKIDGMLSVNAATGAVWYHTWHGTFIAASEE